MIVGQSGTVTLLFSDLVNSTELLQQAGDEAGQRLFQAHHKLITDAVNGSGGEELEWLGVGGVFVGRRCRALRHQHRADGAETGSWRALRNKNRAASGRSAATRRRLLRHVSRDRAPAVRSRLQRPD